MAQAGAVELRVDGIAEALHVGHLLGYERVHAPFSMEVTVAALRADGSRIVPSPEDSIGRAAEIELPLADGSSRRIVGVVDGVQYGYADVAFTVVPPIAPLGRTRDHRVFLDRDAVEIAAEVLGEHAIEIERRLVRKPPKRAQCVQGFESDLEFVSRLLAEEGITWLARPEAPDTLVLEDHPSAHEPIDGDESLPVRYESGFIEQECVLDVAMSHALATDALRLRDYDFERPLLDQDVDSAAGPGALRRYEFRAGYRDPAIGRELAALRLEEARAMRVVLRGRSNCLRLSAGRTFTLTEGGRDDLDRRWLIIQTRLEFRDAPGSVDRRRSTVTFLAVPADTPYRPQRTRVPTMGGVQTATVTGPAGSEIHTERHGRSTCLLRGDRRRPADETSSYWFRPLQPQTSGAVYLPRVGWEVLLGFEGPSADTPYVLGRLDNGSAPPAESLPVQKVRGAFGSRTTPGGGGANVMRTDDAAGSEGFLLAASSDYNERTESDKTVDVTADETRTVGADHARAVGQVCEVVVDAAQTYSVGADRSLDVAETMAVSSASESVSVGGMRSFDVGGDSSTESTGPLSRLVGAAKIETAVEAHHRHVTGAATVVIGGAWNELAGVAASVGVGGTHVRAISGPIAIRTPKCSIDASALSERFGSHSVTADGGVGIQFSGGGSLKTGGAAIMKGSKVIVKATSSLTIKAGGTTIEMTPSAIVVKGPFDSGVPVVVEGTDKTE